jgi:hypothetical protein
VTPRLSVVKQPTEAIARRAWEFLIRRMADEADGVQREQLQAEVIFRESIEPVPDKRAVARSADPPPADGSKARTSVRDHARSR